MGNLYNINEIFRFKSNVRSYTLVSSLNLFITIQLGGWIEMKNRSKQNSYMTAMILLIVLLFNFQNCSQPGSINVSSKDAVSGLGTVDPDPVNPGGGGINPVNDFSTETFVNTELNTPVEFILSPVTVVRLTGVRITSQTFSALQGNLAIVNAAQFKFKYTPMIGFRGSDLSQVTGLDDKSQKISFNIKIVVANPVQNLKPALAIRGMGCIQCHAKVESNIITDFGYGSNYYFNNNTGSGWWKSGGIYGDHANNFNSMDLNSSLKVIVPKAALPTQVASDTGLTTLADYVGNQLKISGIERTKLVSVQEISKVNIGAPTAADIINAFSLQSGDRSKYFRNSDNSIAVSGLSDEKTYFKNSGVVNCEGDLALRGPLYLNHLKVNSSSGCRIYVIGSVFINGPILQVNANDNRNLQITSNVSISMGLGLTRMDDISCEPNGRYATDQASYGINSLINRYSTFWTIPGYYTRAATDPKANGAAILAEAAAIEKGEGTLMDASCGVEGRNIGFDRLFLNAPAIQSRYEGNFIGTIIAEYSVMSLGMFKFEYDKVFDRVPLLPMLKSQIYLSVEQ